EDSVRDLEGCRLALRAELAPEPADDADRRMLAAMTQPRRLDQIWPLARTPRYRMLAFLHLLRSLGALDIEAPTHSSDARASTRPTGAATKTSRLGSTSASTNASSVGSAGASTNAARAGSTGAS